MVPRASRFVRRLRFESSEHQSPASAARDFSELGVGSLINGAAAFGIATTATHTYGSADASGFVTLWTIWLLATALLTFPLQHWIVLQGRNEIPARRLLALALLPTIATLVVAIPARNALFQSASLAYPLIAAGIVAGAVPMGVFRGSLMAAGRVRHTAMILAGENVARLLAAVLVAAAGGSAEAFSSTILVGYLVLASFPQAWSSGNEGSTDETGRVREVFRTIGFVGSSMLVSQVVLAGGPLLLAATGAAAAVVTATFATLEICGSVYLLTVGTSLRFTAMLADKRAALSLQRIGSVVCLGGVAMAGVAATAAALIGPQTIGWLFGSDSRLPRASTSLIAGACVLAATGLLLLLVAVAANRSPHAFFVWLGAASVGVCAFAVNPAAADLRFAVAFLLVECIAVAGLTLLATWSEDRERDSAPTNAPSAPSEGLAIEFDVDGTA
jgi:hypothetical protein